MKMDAKVTPVDIQQVIAEGALETRAIIALEFSKL